MACPGNPNCGKSIKTTTPKYPTIIKPKNQGKIMLNGKLWEPKKR